jgi:zinc protease
MTVANYILGEGGPSRLFMNIRSRMGLAYVVASFYTEPKGPGLAGVVCQTKAASALTAIRALQSELSKIETEPVTDEELQSAKDSIVHSFVFKFDNPGEVVQEQANLDFYGFPTDNLRTYPKKITLISKKDITRVAKSYLNVNNLKIMVVGDKKKFAEPLEKLGPVIEVPLASIE